ncbi:MAG: ABC transporter ATP-binding protein [Thermoguttaceae bacterium]|jgi:ABC-type lipoprotein export system ATPase subunit|nr:ABC transporter ATP-binding protein [Thermoguttaceae bacterium]
MIQLENVEKVYRRSDGFVRALAGVTLDIEAGCFVVVRGPSGCGKSTLLNVIGGLASPTAGRVRVAGQDLSAMSAAERARFRASHVGFVFQTFHLLPYLTVLENVAMAALPGQEAAAKKRAHQLLYDFHLADRAGHRPAELSTGECQRVAIARALINQPRLLLADEPTGNLDPQNTATVLDLLETFHRQGGTVVLVTHQQVASNHAQRTILLHEGKIESSDSPASMLAEGPLDG